MLQREKEVKQGQKKSLEAKLNIRGSARVQMGNFLDLGEQSVEVLRLVWYTKGEIKVYQQTVVEYSLDFFYVLGE